MLLAKLTPEQIDALREKGLKDWAAASTDSNEVHRYLARAVERHFLKERASLLEENITLESALCVRHEENARLTIRVGQLEEALRQAGLRGRGAPPRSGAA